MSDTGNNGKYSYNPFDVIAVNVRKGMKEEEALVVVARDILSVGSTEASADGFYRIAAEQLLVAALGYVNDNENGFDKNLDSLCAVLKEESKYISGGCSGGSKWLSSLEGSTSDKLYVKSYNMYSPFTPNARETIAMIVSTSLWSRSNALSKK